MKKIKWLIAREGLIILAIAAVFMLAKGAFFSKIEFLPPQYKLQLANGSAMYLRIYPEIHPAGAFDSAFFREMYHPSAALVDKRIKEFAESNRIVCVGAARVVSWQDAFREGAADFLARNMFLQIGLVYLLLSILRFAAWAVCVIRTQRRKDAA